MNVDEILAELKLLYHICLKKNRGKTHKERMEIYFGPQSRRYDHFRERLLYGRRELYQKLPTIENGIWLEMGGGTGQCLDFLGERIRSFKKIYIVDLSSGLLEIAKERIKRNHWSNVECVEEDVNQFSIPEGKADVITFSYSLTMIPDWFKVLNWASENLGNGGRIGVVDFYMPRKFPLKGHPKLSAPSRIFWQAFFMGDNVFPCKDHIPYLIDKFEGEDINFGRSKIPYLPIKSPWYSFIGRPKVGLNV